MDGRRKVDEVREACRTCIHKREGLCHLPSGGECPAYEAYLLLLVAEARRVA